MAAQIPPQPDAADNFVRVIISLRHASIDLFPEEEAAYKAALECLRNYFTGENLYARIRPDTSVPPPEPY